MPDPLPLWHVTVTVGGPHADVVHLHRSLSHLLQERPFLHSVRYTERVVELQYWDEGDDIVDVAALGYRLWWEHRESCRLPDWKTVGLEVVSQAVYADRGSPGAPRGQVRPERF